MSMTLNLLSPLKCPAWKRCSKNSLSYVYLWLGYSHLTFNSLCVSLIFRAHKDKSIALFLLASNLCPGELLAFQCAISRASSLVQRTHSPLCVLTGQGGSGCASELITAALKTATHQPQQLRGQSSSGLGSSVLDSVASGAPPLSTFSEHIKTKASLYSFLPTLGAQNCLIFSHVCMNRKYLPHRRFSTLLSFRHPGSLQTGSSTGSFDPPNLTSGPVSHTKRAKRQRAHPRQLCPTWSQQIRALHQCQSLPISSSDLVISKQKGPGAKKSMSPPEPSFSLPAPSLPTSSQHHHMRLVPV